MESFFKNCEVIIWSECGQIYQKPFGALLNLTTPRPILSLHNTKKMILYSLFQAIYKLFSMYMDEKFIS